MSLLHRSKCKIHPSKKKKKNNLKLNQKSIKVSTVILPWIMLILFIIEDVLDL